MIVSLLNFQLLNIRHFIKPSCLFFVCVSLVLFMALLHLFCVAAVLLFYIYYVSRIHLLFYFILVFIENTMAVMNKCSVAITNVNLQRQSE